MLGCNYHDVAGTGVLLAELCAAHDGGVSVDGHGYGADCPGGDGILGDVASVADGQYGSDVLTGSNWHIGRWGCRRQY